LCQMGSVAYGVSGDSSDIDLYGFCVPPKDNVFPHLAGEIKGFGKQVDQFENWQQHHIIDPSSQKEYDFAIFSIQRYFSLCMENNPNMIDSLFVPRRCILHSTGVGDNMRENRKMFLHKGAFKKFKGYAYAQMTKMRNGTMEAMNGEIVTNRTGKRAADIEKNGYDTKFAYHIVRLTSECEQILSEHDLDLEANSEQLKSIRRGEWTLQQIEEWFYEKEKSLEVLYANSTLPAGPDEVRIKQLFIECLEQHFGNLDSVVSKNPSMDNMITDLENVIRRYR
jgi:predicted nucleotidyltransferase